ncbi:Hsp20/alpha crystallin family protein [Natronobacterium gregoryi]|uniref:Heat shock protein Hsp20 n=2 Tax=Natronobacterium gregoryi TaxID=44930 RepID=L0AFB7_NATGS|nr:Hsp20/alpha crystallin family protein [Natronobacterium gregoryi]AFZ71837.1 molecular chaperone (small heat shock protein) [Natronobacterium gregoryi SP2]ELY72989.1 heat shock protein Hsp20 [Natronobacterium gregoryi SP2]PLK19131.1 Hsp20/alpha crystallin family protein [Natronobacterium gregoryi SP2]SFJ60255.1 Hsp20/alpha crystallin family protein [Natronobacterium gregoryi]
MSLKDVRNSIGKTLYRGIGRANGRIQSHRSLPVDILEDETSYLVVFDAPGAEPDDVQVRYLEGNVRIRIERFRQFRDRYEMRFPGRGMTLGGEAELPSDAIVDPDAGTATITETGTLNVEIPKDRSPDATGSSDATEEKPQTDVPASDG